MLAFELKKVRKINYSRHFLSSFLIYLNIMSRNMQNYLFFFYLTVAEISNSFCAEQNLDQLLMASLFCV